MTEPADSGEQGRPLTRLLPLIALLAVVAAALIYFHLRPDDGEEAHAAIVSALEKRHRTGDAERVRRACAGRAAGSCACRQEAASRALDRDLHAEATAVLAGKPECAHPGIEAEALARAKLSDEAIAKANEVLVSAPKDKHAAYALARALYTKGDAVQALAAARRAIEAGRGATAHLLAGLIAYHSGDLASARGEFEKMLASNADDLDAHYNIAVVAGRENRYRDAREGYLRVLELDPSHFEARHNLVLLTHWAGAKAEAQHHLRKLEAIAEKDDERLALLKATLAAPPPAPATVAPPVGSAPR